MNNKRGEGFDQIVSLGLGIATLAIVLIVTFIVIAQGQTQIETATGFDCNTSNSASIACNATNEINSSVAQIPGWLPIVVIVGMGVAVLSVLLLLRR
jgi:hypothetical protein